jgi:hypothetical protein
MTAERFDVLVAGAGIIGAAAAVAAARAGRAVGLTRLPSDGAQDWASLLSAREISHAVGDSGLSSVASGPVVERRLLFLDGASALSIDFGNPELPRGPAPVYLVPHRRLADELARTAQSAGAVLLEGSGAWTTLVHGSTAAGIAIDGKEIHAAVTLFTQGGPTPTPQGAFTPPPRVACAAEAHHLPVEVLATRAGLDPGSALVIDAFLPAGPGTTNLPAASLYASGDTAFLTACVWNGTNVLARNALRTFREHSSIGGLVRGSSSANSEGTDWAGDASPVVSIGGGFLRVDPAAVPWPARLGVRVAPELLAVGRWLGEFAATSTGVAGAKWDAARFVGEFRRRFPSPRAPPTGRAHSKYPHWLATTFHELMTETGAPKRRVGETLRETTRRSRIRPTEVVKDLRTLWKLL